MKLFKSIFRSTVVVTIIFLILVAMPSSTALADADGPNFPASGENVDGIGTEAWQTPGNITASDSNYATVTFNKSQHISNYLRGTSYGFSIPEYANVTGIEVVVNRMASTTTPPPVRDNALYLVKGTTRVGTNKASAAAWPATLGTATYGGPADLWGTTWTPTEVGTIGVDLSATTGNNGDTKILSVDYITVKVFYSFTSTTTEVDCGSGIPTTTYGTFINCVATVTGVVGGATPAGTVSWGTSGSGTFATSPCTLSPLSAGIASCSVDYTPTAVGTSGIHTITASFNGETSFAKSSGTQDVTVAKADPTCNVTLYNVTYDGNAHTATGSCTGVGSDGTLSGLDLSATTHTNASDYPTDAWTFTDVTGNYNDDDGTVHDVIAKADATCLVTPYNVTYNGNAHTATGSCTGVGSDGTLNGLVLSATTHTNANDYPTDAWTFTDVTGNYNDDNGTVHDIIAKANATCLVTPYNVTFDNKPHTATGSCTGVGSDGTLSGLDLSGTIHTNVGTYNDPWTFINVTGNYNNSNGTITDVISAGKIYLPVVLR